MILKHYTLLVLFCLGVTINALSQTKQITEAEYYQTFNIANKKRLETSSRVVTQREYYDDGKLSKTEKVIDEFLKPDRKHYLEVGKFADKENKGELIQIGKTFYCRNNDENWKPSKNWCLDTGLSGISGIVSSKFTVEDAKIDNQTVKLYQRYTTYKNTYSPNKDKEGLSYWESRFWLSKDGFILREEAKDGLLEPSELNWKSTDIYEYNPKHLKIEAPIK